MAATYRTSSAGGGTTATGNRSITITPAVGDLLVVFVQWSGNSATNPTCTDDNSGTYTLVGTALNNASGDIQAVFVRNALMVNTTSTVITPVVGSGNNTAGEIVCVHVSGMARVGNTGAVRQFGKQENQTSGVPTPVLPANALTTNMTIMSVGSSGTGTLTCVPNASWTERQDAQQSSPVTALEVATRDSGFTGTSAAYASIVSALWNSFIIELDGTSPISASVTASGSASGTLTGAGACAATLAGTSSISATLVDANAITQDAVSQIGAQTGSSYSWSHTCSGSNRVLLVAVHIGTFPLRTVTGITYNSVAMTKVDARTSGSSDRIELWYLIAPSTGSNSIAVTLDGAGNSFAGALSLNNVDQTTAVEASGLNSGSDASVDTISASATVATSGAWLIGAFEFSNPNFINTVQSPAVKLYQHVQFSTSAGLMAKKASVSSGSQTITVDSFGNSPWAAIAASIKPASQGAISASLTASASSSSTLVGAGALSGSAAGVTTISASLAGAGALTGSSTGIASLTADLRGAGALLSAVTAVASISATLLASGVLAGSTAGTSSVSSTLIGSGALLSDLAGTSDATGDLSAEMSDGDISADVSASASLTAELLASGALTSSLTAASTIVGDLRGAGALASTLSATASCSAALVGDGTLAASCVSVASSTATLLAAGALSSSITATAVLTASLTGDAAASSQLTGTASSSATLEGAGALASSLSGSASITGFAADIASMSATISASSTMLASLSGLALIETLVSATATLEAELSTVEIARAALSRDGALTGRQALKRDGALANRASLKRDGSLKR